MLQNRCCHFSRRDFLRWSGLVAATPLVASLADTERAYGLTRAVLAGPSGIPINFELVTLTETSAIVTWFTGDPTRIDNLGRLAPLPADTEVLLGTSTQTLRTVFHDATPTPYHYVELTGLEPGQTYVCVARSGGLPAVPAATSLGSVFGTSALGSPTQTPLVFTTPQPPPGGYLFSVALCNDLHLGETVAGLATTQQGIQIPPGISQVPGRPPYPQVMAAALGVEARARGASVLLAAGDISSEAAQSDTVDAKSYLDAFGALGTDYFVARGNHDRPHNTAGAANCSAVAGADGYHDCFVDSFAPSGPTWFSHETHGLRIVGLDTYDKIGTGGDNGVMSEAQFGFVADTLATNPDQPTIVFGHHPVNLEASATTIVPIAFDLDPQQSVRLTQMYAANQGVFLHHAGHTHRNKRSLSPDAPGVVFQEVAAVKEYPGGFHLLRAFSGGYALNYYKFRDPLAQEWAERSRPEYLGLMPNYTFGNAADRNSVVVRDLSGLSTTP